MKTKLFTIIGVVLLASLANAQLLSPGDGASFSDIPPTFSWSSTFLGWIEIVPGYFGDPILISPSFSGSGSWTPEMSDWNTLSSGTYYWNYHRWLIPFPEFSSRNFTKTSAVYYSEIAVCPDFISGPGCGYSSEYFFTMGSSTFQCTTLYMSPGTYVSVTARNPIICSGNTYNFSRWSDGVTTRTRNIGTPDPMCIVFFAEYTMGSTSFDVTINASLEGVITPGITAEINGSTHSLPYTIYDVTPGTDLTIIPETPVFDGGALYVLDGIDGMDESGGEFSTELFGEETYTIRYSSPGSSINVELRSNYEEIDAPNITISGMSYTTPDEASFAPMSRPISCDILGGDHFNAWIYNNMRLSTGNPGNFDFNYRNGTLWAIYEKVSYPLNIYLVTAGYDTTITANGVRYNSGSYKTSHRGEIIELEAIDEFVVGIHTYNFCGWDDGSNARIHLVAAVDETTFTANYCTDATRYYVSVFSKSNLGAPILTNFELNGMSYTTPDTIEADSGSVHIEFPLISCGMSFDSTSLGFVRSLLFNVNRDTIITAFYSNKLTKIAITPLCTLYADYIHELSRFEMAEWGIYPSSPMLDHSYRAEGNVSINHMLNFTGSVTFEVSGEGPGLYASVSGNSRVYADVPIFGDVTLYQGILDDTEIMNVNYTGLFRNTIGSKLEYGGFRIVIDTILVYYDSLIVAGDLKLPEQICNSEGVHFDYFKLGPPDGLDVVGLIRLPDFSFNSIGLCSMNVYFNTLDDVFGGGLKADAGAISIDSCSFKFISGALDEIIVVISVDPGVAIGPTGIFITGGGGGFTGLTTPTPGIYVSASISGGPSVGGITIVELKEADIYIKPFSYVEAGGFLWIAGNEMADGNISLGAEGLRTWGTVWLPSHATTIAEGDFDVNLSGDGIIGSMTGTLTTPVLPWPFDGFSGEEMGGFNAYVENEEIRADIYFSLDIYGPDLWDPLGDWVFYETISLDGACKLELGSPSHFYIGEDYYSLTRVFRASTKGPLLLSDAHTVRFMVTEADLARRVLFAAKSSGGDTLSNFLLVSPSGDTLNQGNIRFFKSVDNRTGFYIMDRTDTLAETGNWLMVFYEDTTALDRIELLSQYSKPLIEMIEPGIPDDANYIECLLNIPINGTPGGTKLYLGYDTDNDGFNGMIFDTVFYLETEVGNFAYSTSLPTDLETGTYYIYAILSDTINTPSRNYAIGSISITNPTAPSPPASFNGYSTDSSLVFVWSPSTDETIDGYIVHLSGDFELAGYEYKFTTGKNTRIEVKAQNGVCDTFIWDDSTYIIPREKNIEIGKMYKAAISAFRYEGAIGERRGIEGPKSDPIMLRLYNRSGNNPPYFTSLIPPRYAFPGYVYEFDFIAHDADGDPLTYSLIAPSFGSLNPSTGHYYWTPSGSVSGRIDMGIRVSDGAGGSDTLYWAVDVFNAQFQKEAHLGNVYFNQGNLRVCSSEGSRKIIVNLRDVDYQRISGIVAPPSVSIESSGGDGASIDVQLHNIGNLLDEFVGYFTISSISATNDGLNILNVRYPDTVWVVYEDLNPIGELDEDFILIDSVNCDSIYAPLAVKEYKKPDALELFAYPNPFNSSCYISVNMNASIEIFDIIGHKISRFSPNELGNSDKKENQNSNIIPQRRSIIWKPNNTIGSGIYLVRATSGNQSVTKRVVYLK